MSFNRVKYDQCAYDLQLGRSIGPGDYRLYAPFAENCNQCIATNGPVGSKADVSLVKENMELRWGEMADTESDLSWRNYKITKCNDPNPVLNKLNESKLKHKPVCSKSIAAEDSRFTHPIDNYRCLSTTALQMSPYLPVNPQCHVQPNNEKQGMSSRISAKDCYVMPVQMFVDDGSALPPSQRK